MLEIPRGRNWQVVHTITDNGDIGVPADMRELQDGELLPVPVRCQIRGKNAVKDPATGLFELPFVQEVTAILSGDTGQTLTLYLNATTTQALQVGDYVLDAVAVWSDHEEALLAPEAVRVVNWPTKLLGVPVFPPDEPVTVPDFVDDFTEALVD